MKPYIYTHSRQYFAFNVWNVESAIGILDAAAILGEDVIIQTSPKAFAALDKEEFQFYVKNYGAKKNIHVYFHLDHCKDIAMINSAIRYGWDSVMLDASDKPLSENIALTKEVINIGHAKGVLIEAEVGKICGVEDDIEVKNAGTARVEDVKLFLEAAGDVDMLAVAIGTAHGQYKGTPCLHYKILEQIYKFSDKPLVIHGGTGLPEETLRELLSHPNVKKINISTDVKQAYREGILFSQKEGNLEGISFNPLKVSKSIHDSIYNMALCKIQLCRNEGQS